MLSFCHLRTSDTTQQTKPTTELPTIWLKWLPVIAVACIFSFQTSAADAQLFGGPPGGRGGPNAPDLEIVKDFDLDKDGILNAAERKKARESLAKTNTSRGGPGGGGPGGRRGGPGGRRGGRGGPGGGGNRPEGKIGPKVSPSDVTNDTKSKFFDTKALRTVFLEFEQSDWEKELAEFKPTDVEIPATMIVDGKTYPNVGVSFRGASSFFSIAEGSKRSLNISMDYMDDKQKLYGYKSLNFLNCNGDSAMMSSVLYSELGGEKMAVPKVNFVKVVINGHSWGIYSNAQQFNKTFLKENYDSKKGNRWKVNGSPQGDAGLRYTGDDLKAYKSKYELKSKENEQAWKDLANLCKVLNETPVEKLEAALEPILDIEGALWFLACDVAFINSDGYWTRASDYSIYQNEAGKFHILPHDMNESFRESHGRGGPGGGGRGGPGGGFFDRMFGPPPEGGPQGGGPQGQGGPPERDQRGGEQQRGGERGQRGGDRGGQRGGGQQGPGGQRGGGGQQGGGYELDPLVGMGQDRFPLRSKLLAHPKFKTLYLQHLRHIAKTSLNWETLGPKVEQWKSLIADEVKADTRKLMTYEAFEKATDSSSPAKPGSVREFAEKRSEYLLDHPEIKKLPEEWVKLEKSAEPKK
jgi:spore coat protein CotH